jgi:H+/Cl- antiporter ClcA
MESLGPLLVAAVASSVLSRYVGKADAYFSSPPFELASPLEIIPYLIMAVGLGIAAPGFVRLLRKTEDWLTALLPQRCVAHGLWRTPGGRPRHSVSGSLGQWANHG